MNKGETETKNSTKDGTSTLTTTTIEHSRRLRCHALQQRLTNAMDVVVVVVVVQHLKENVSSSSLWKLLHARRRSW
jgi:hypothetical protein